MKRMKQALLALAVALFPLVAQATHVPPGSEPVQYDGALSPGVAATGSIGWTDPKDGYDWYCLNVTKGRKVSFSLTRKSGDIKLNIGFLQGVTAKDNDPVSTLKIVGETSNSSTPDITFSVTPDFDGPATVWVSTWLGENGGSYVLLMTGGNPATACGTSTTPPPPPADQINVTVPTNPILVTENQSTVIPISVVTANGFADDINLSVTGIGDDIAAKFDQSTFPNPGNGQTNLTLTTGGFTMPGTNFVTVIASAANGTAIGAATFQFVVDCEPPFIFGVDQPKNVSVSSGSTAQVSVTANGTAPLTYQWYQGFPGMTANPVDGGNNATLTTPTINGTRQFWVRVSNACGSVDSQPATVTTK